MARDWNKAVLTDQGTILTPKCKLIYPSLFRATVIKGEKDMEKARYNSTLAFPKAADLSLLVKAVNDTIAEKLSEAQRKVTKIKKPFIKIEDQPKIAAMFEKAEIDPADFPVLIRVAAKFKPVIKAANLDDVTDEEQVYSGRWACVSVRPFWFDHPVGGKGVSLGLSNVQLLDNDDMLSGGRADANKEFEAVETGDGTADSVFD